MKAKERQKRISKKGGFLPSTPESPYYNGQSDRPSLGDVSDFITCDPRPPQWVFIWYWGVLGFGRWGFQLASVSPYHTRMLRRSHAADNETTLNQNREGFSALWFSRSGSDAVTFCPAFHLIYVSSFSGLIHRRLISILSLTNGQRMAVQQKLDFFYVYSGRRASPRSHPSHAPLTIAGPILTLAFGPRSTYPSWSDLGTLSYEDFHYLVNLVMVICGARLE
jgi:hypothetical protein